VAHSAPREVLGCPASQDSQRYSVPYTSSYPDRKMKEHDSPSALLVLGPSGAGKSTLGTWLVEDLNLLHLEIDQWPPVDGVDLAGIRTEWDLFLRERSAGPLAEILAMQAATVGRAGTVLTFPSTLLLPVQWLESARASGIRAVVLYGSRPECLDAFLSREAATGRRLNVAHWVRNNESFHAVYGRPEYSGWRLATFESGARRPRVAIVAEISKRLAC
jgi:hypothetical protein